MFADIVLNRRATAGKSHVMLNQMYGDGTVFLNTVCAWFKIVVIRPARPHLKQPGSWFLLHDNARPHTATLVKRFLAQRGVTELSHPPYFPHLSPQDFLPFPKLIVVLKGRIFTDITHIQDAMTLELKAVLVEEFSRAFDNLYARCQKCIMYDGEYFEGLETVSM
ncbi:hypothetical protein AVEN_100884-1 [Araneus ventricosus]|uniref:Histone-lysine N-methyltransferase SETMAR n=1 Tax=Araneus ventricosus TaxID=182803 RepID=A0A4Y2AVD5_ARAVE|nr:hypothetical protein AVEN_100884-1 [Araneus ventricosus]